MTHDYRTVPILSDALAYWQRKRGSRTMPRRRDLDPTEIPHLLANVQLVESVDGGQRFRYRLIGTAIVQAFGRDYTGKHLDELFSGERQDLAHSLYRTVCERRQPIFLRNKYTTTKDVDLVANRLFLPLSEDGESVNLLFGVLTFEFGVEPVVGVWQGATLLAAGQEIQVVDPGEPRAP